MDTMKKTKLLVVFFMMVLLVTSCVATNDAQNSPADAPSKPPLPAKYTPTATLSWKPTPIPTVSPRPTSTTTPLPDWIINFTEPILKAIADRPPTYEDDFSNPKSGWYNGQTTGHPNILILGEKRYDNEEYYVVASGATADEPIVCSGVEDRNMGRYVNFVVEFDVRYVSGVDGDWGLQFLRSSNGLYKFQIGRDGHILFGRCGFDLGDGCADLERSFGNSIKRGNEWNHIQLIVQGERMAAYVNDVPSLYAYDAAATADSSRGYFSVTSCNRGSTPLETRWDNFKLWNISDLP